MSNTNNNHLIKIEQIDHYTNLNQLNNTGLNGIPDALEYPIAAGTPESGTPIIKSASIWHCSQSFFPDNSLKW